MVEIWNQFVQQNKLEKYTYDFVTEEINSDTINFIPILDMILNKLGQIYWDKYRENVDVVHWSDKDFKQLEPLDKWRIIYKKFVLAKDLKEAIQRMLTSIEKSNEFTQGYSLIAAIQELEHLMENVVQIDAEAIAYDFIKVPPFAVVEIQRIPERQLNFFWCEFLVHHELDANLDLENLKMKMSYNTSALFNSISKILRPLAYTKMQYLAANQQKKPLPLSDLTSKALKNVWANLEEFGLPKKDKLAADQVIKTLELQVVNKNVPKKLVQLTFNNFIYLFKSLYADALSVSDNAPMKIKQVIEEFTIANSNEEAEKSHATFIEEEVVTVNLIATKEKNNDATSEEMIEQVNDVAENIQPVKQKKKQVSKFLQQSKVLLTSAPEAVVHANHFGTLQKYMHVVRPIEQSLIETLEEANKKNEPQLILLCGSAGDGKSHLLAYMKDEYSELIEDYIIHNDATVSKSRTKSNLETLEELLKGYNDGATPQKSIIIAINLGVLHNFYTYEKEKNQFETLCRFIEDINIFDQTSTATSSDIMLNCHVLDFSQEKNYELTEKRVESNLFLQILNRIVANTEENIFYQSWKEDMDNGIVTAAHLNYELLQNTQIQQQIVQYLIYGIFKDKLFISTRTYNEFIFSLIVPTDQELDEQRTAIDLSNTLPNLMFAHENRSTTLAAMTNNDPLKEKSATKDTFITNVLLSMDIYSYFESQFGELIKPYEKPIKKAILEKQLVELAQFGIRLQKLTDASVTSLFDQYVEYLYGYFVGNEEKTGELFEQLEQIIFKWRGSPGDDFVYLNNDLNREFRTAIPMSLEPTINEDFYGQMEGNVLTRFVPSIKIGFESYIIDLDFRLYEILSSVRQGHRLNNLEVSNAIQFEEFYNALTKNAQQKDNRLMIVNTSNREKMIISKPKFSKSKYEVKKV